MDFWTEIAIALAFGWFLWLAQETHRRTRTIEMRQRRLSVTYLQILTELNLLHRANVELLGQTKQGQELSERIAFWRKVLLSNRIQEQTSVDLLAGLELPDFKEDKAFWKGDISAKLGLKEERSDHL